MGQCQRTISKDKAFHVLQNSRRRAILRYLLARPEQDQFVMRTVAEAVAAWEHDLPVRQLSSEQRQRVYIPVYQSHLPKLDDYGIITYNQDRGIVEPTPLLHVVAPYLGEGLHGEADDLRAPTDTGSDHTLTRTVSAILGR